MFSCAVPLELEAKNIRCLITYDVIGLREQAFSPCKIQVKLLEVSSVLMNSPHFSCTSIQMIPNLLYTVVVGA